VLRPATAPGDDPDLLAALGQQFGDARADRAGSDDDVE
jgi:hypothetical protein